MQCVCRFCGAGFDVPPSHVARGAGVYCSRICQGKQKSISAGLAPVSERPAPKAQTLGIDRAKLLLRKRKYRERHLEAERARRHDWGIRNREYLHAKNKAWRLAHPGQGLEGVKRWRINNPEWDAAAKRAGACNRRAKEMGAPGHISRVDVTGLWERQPVCVQCGHGRGVDHILEFWQGGANTAANLQNLCRQCNVEKTARLRFHQSC